MAPSSKATRLFRYETRGFPSLPHDRFGFGLSPLLMVAMPPPGSIPKAMPNQPPVRFSFDIYF
jgi:hypothetical protein